jgi:hypothetical protein
MKNEKLIPKEPSSRVQRGPGQASYANDSTTFFQDYVKQNLEFNYYQNRNTLNKQIKKKTSLIINSETQSIPKNIRDPSKH